MPRTSKPAATLPNARGEARAKLDDFGLSGVCSLIADGKSLTEIAKKVGVSIGTLLVWVESDAERSARVREARASTAKLWDNRATEVIEEATDPFRLAKAKELAHHYRWRASKIAPRDYGDKLDLTHTGSLELNDSQLDARIAAAGAALIAAIGEAAASGAAGADRGEDQEGSGEAPA